MRRLIVLAVAGLVAGRAHAQGPAPVSPPPMTLAPVPEALSRPGDAPLLRLSATGVQIYECRAGTDGALAWAFKAPRADLLRDGQRIGRHGAGPFWEIDDGSRIVGRAVASVPALLPGDIPWLRLTVTEHGGTGALASVTAVQRVATRGGAKAGPCENPETLAEVPYTADYVMLRAAP